MHTNQILQYAILLPDTVEPHKILHYFLNKVARLRSGEAAVWAAVLQASEELHKDASLGTPLQL
jgi:precorrin-4 methylase